MDDSFDTGDELRCSSWDEYIGQEKLKAKLALHIEAANMKDRTLDHVLLAAAPGYGKTSLARIIAKQTGYDLRQLEMPVKTKVLCGLLREWDGGVLLLDEIHRGSKAQQQDLLPLLLDGYLQLDNGRRVYASESLCVIGTTTEPWNVIEPLRDRFPLKPRFVDYTDEQMGQVVTGMGARVGFTVSEIEAVALGKAAGESPRHARALVLAARDLIDTGAKPTVSAILDLADTEPDGLTPDHRLYLHIMKDLGGAAVGERTLATMMRLPAGVIREIERLLIKRGLLRLETTGRELTNAGFQRAKGVAA